MKKQYTKRQIQESIAFWENVLLESKVTDLIEKNKWTKEDALKPDNFKQIKKAWKKGDDYMKKVIDRIFDKSGKFVGAETATKVIAKVNEEEKKGKDATGDDNFDASKETAKGEDTAEPMKPDAKDKAAADAIIDDKETVETAVGDFNIWTRMHRLHNGAVSKVKKNLGQFLNKQKAGSPETVVVTNSCDKENVFEPPKDGKMYITIAVKLDKTQLTGFRKMVALMKESKFYDAYDKEMLNEGFFGDFVAGLKAGAKALGKAAKDTAAAMGKTAEEKLKTAHERLKKNIGVEAMRTYVTAFCGKKLGDQVSLKNIAMNEDEAGAEGAEISFKSLINVVG